MRDHYINRPARLLPFNKKHLCSVVKLQLRASQQVICLPISTTTETGVAIAYNRKA
ncbi:hypothetical protein BaRGS_00016176, partial [Batillaria attramentaria]